MIREMINEVILKFFHISTSLGFIYEELDRNITIGNMKNWTVYPKKYTLESFASEIYIKAKISLLDMNKSNTPKSISKIVSLRIDRLNRRSIELLVQKHPEMKEVDFVLTEENLKKFGFKYLIQELDAIRTSFQAEYRASIYVRYYSDKRFIITTKIEYIEYTNPLYVGKDMIAQERFEFVGDDERAIRKELSRSIKKASKIFK